MELLVVFVLIGAISSIALVNFKRSSSEFTVAGAARTLSVYMERVRVDSMRRHGGSSIIINSTSSYTVNIAAAGTGATVAKTITLPVGMRLTYNLPPATTSITPSDTPITIVYDWRGRTPTTVSLNVTDSASGVRSNAIVVGNAGDISMDTTITGPVTNPTPQNSTITTTTAIKTMH